MKFPSIANGESISNYSFYASFRSRDFFFYCLSNLKKINVKKIIIPSFIGHTESEGSGVMDSIVDSGLDYIIYPLDKNLRINKTRLISIINQERYGETALLLIHYFGLIDPCYSSIIEIAEQNKVFIFDDCAHSYYTYYLFNDSFHGDAAFFSLHKLVNNTFPKSFSLIKNNKSKLFYLKINQLLKEYTIEENYNLLYPLYSEENFEFFPIINGINHIIEKRIIQAKIYKNFLDKNSYPFNILIPEESYKYPLQSFPILFSDKVNRDEVFHQMRKSGVQVVSLYYSLSSKINNIEFPEAYHLSKNILNLPINEDLKKEEIINICESLIKIIKKISTDK